LIPSLFAIFRNNTGKDNTVHAAPNTNDWQNSRRRLRSSVDKRMSQHAQPQAISLFINYRKDKTIGKKPYQEKDYLDIG
jgi:hypothetical protein